jgi:NTE family protein
VPSSVEGLDIGAALAAVSLFAALSEHEQRTLAGSADVRTFHRGEVLFRTGDDSSSVHVVVTGEVDVTTSGGVATPRQVRRLGPGELFGELGVLLGRTRTATVTAARPTTTLELRADAFRQAITVNPLALEQVSTMIASRLVSTTRGDRTNNTPRIVLVTGEPRVPGRSLVAATITAMLHDVTDRTSVWLELVDRPPSPDRSESDAISLETLITDPTSIPSGPTGWAGGTRHLRVAAPIGPDSIAHLGEALDRLRARFTFIVVDVPDSWELPGAVGADLGDAVVHVTHRVTLAPAPTGARRLLVLNLHDSRAHTVPLNHNEPVVMRSESSIVGLPPETAAEQLLIDQWAPTSRALRRLVRTLLGSTVGLALGGGAAFGLAHVGVLEVLDDNTIPVDLVVGTSMGSIVATGYAAGIPSGEIHAAAERIGRSVKSFAGMVDLNPTTPGVLSGRRLQRTFAPLLGSIERFDDLAIPCQTVAADIETGERVSIGSGRLEDAFRASSSIPLLVAPWLHRGHVLVDGAIVDPVPAEVTREMGADLAIAVNVVPHLRKGVTNVISRVVRNVSNVNPLSVNSRNRGLPNVVDTTMNTIQSLQHELGQFKAASADVRINPDLADVTWIEFYKAALIMERGRLAAEAALPAIRRVLAERLAAALPD